MGEADSGFWPFKPNVLCLAAIWLQVRVLSRSLDSIQHSAISQVLFLFSVNP